MKKKEYTLSKYQEDIFKFIKEGVGNAVVEASAGAGKTFTLLRTIDIIPEDKKILLIAFNRDIVEELKGKVKRKENITISTLHSLGLRMLYGKYRGKEKLEINANKYRTYLNKNMASLINSQYYAFHKRDKELYTKNILQLTDLSRMYLCRSMKEVKKIAFKYGVNLLLDECSVVTKLTAWGVNNLDEIDYTDMIWLPNELGLGNINTTYDWILLDEAQDMNKAQREMVLKTKRIGSRMISVGDKNQAINSFAGSDAESFDELKKLPNTITLPLSITYRCADKIVDFAQRYTDNIEKNNDGRPGEIIYDAPISILQDGDMVLCRTNAPLSKVYADLLEENKKSFIRGKNIGENLIKYIDSFSEKEINSNMEKKGLVGRMYEDLLKTRERVMTKYELTAKEAIGTVEIQNLLDQISTIEILSKNTNLTSELIETIGSIFSDTEAEGIALSTIHKAKGLEADRVFIVCNSLMPSKLAKLPWEITQERNLQYVAYTRAKNVLGFLNEDGFSKLNTTSLDCEDAKLKHIEFLVEKLYGKKKKKGVISQPKKSTNNAPVDSFYTPSKDITEAHTLTADTITTFMGVKKANKKRKKI